MFGDGLGSAGYFALQDNPNTSLRHVHTIRAWSARQDLLRYFFRCSNSLPVICLKSRRIGFTFLVETRGRPVKVSFLFATYIRSIAVDIHDTRATPFYETLHPDTRRGDASTLLDLRSLLTPYNDHYTTITTTGPPIILRHHTFRAPKISTMSCRRSILLNANYLLYIATPLSERGTGRQCCQYFWQHFCTIREKSLDRALKLRCGYDFKRKRNRTCAEPGMRGMTHTTLV